MPKHAQFYNREIEVPDYDFYSPHALDDAKELENEELVNWVHDEHGSCSLLRASTELVRASFMSILLERGADVNAMASDGATVLMMASYKEDPSCISLLLDGGADIDTKGNYGWTTLMISSRESFSAIIYC